MVEVSEEQVEQAHAAVKAKLTPDTFDFAAAVTDRNYPEFDVSIYLDEHKIQQFMDIHDERLILDKTIREKKGSATVAQANKHKEVNDRYEAIYESLKADEYIVKVRGISPEQSIALETKSREAFPVEYTEEKNAITGATVKTEVESDKRDAFYTNLIRQAHLISVTAPTGAVDSDFSDIAKVQTIIERLPYLARERIDNAINNATITADFYRVLVDPVF